MRGQTIGGRTVLTYGTFDLFHIGHLRLLERLAALGDRLVVGVSTDEFNEKKGKESINSYADRSAIVGSIKGVDLVIAENSWEQKPEDISKYEVTTFAMGDDWVGKFDHLSPLCDVIYLPRTTGISTSGIQRMMRALDPSHLAELQSAVTSLTNLLAHYRELA